MKTDILVVNYINVKRKRKIFKKQSVHFKIKKYKTSYLFKDCIATAPTMNHMVVNDPININITFTYGETNEIKH